LTRFGGLTQAQAAGTSLPTQIFANIASGLTFASAGLVDPLAATTLGVFSTVGARYGARLSLRVSEEQYKAIFGGLLLFLSPIILFGSLKGERKLENKQMVYDSDEGKVSAAGNNWVREWEPDKILSKARAKPIETTLLSCFGVVVGVLSGSLGIGATPVMISFLSLYPRDNNDYKTCIGTALCAVVPCTIMGSASHAQLGTTQWVKLPMLVCGSTLGGILGSSVSLYLPSAILQQTFALFCAVSGGSMLKRTYKTLVKIKR